MTHTTHTTRAAVRRAIAAATAAAALAAGFTVATAAPAFGFDCDDNQAQIKFGGDTDFACQSVGAQVYLADDRDTAVGEVCAGDDMVTPVTVAVVGGRSTGPHVVAAGTCQVFYEDEQISAAVTVQL